MANRTSSSSYGRGEFGGYSEITTNTPGFWKKKVLGQRLPNNNYYWTRYDGTAPVATTYNGQRYEADARGLQTFQGAVDTGVVNTNTGVTVPLSYSRTQAEAVLANKLLNKVRNIDLDVGVTIGEFRETAEFVSGALTSVARAVLEVRRGNIPGVLRALKVPKSAKEFNNAFLAYTYGVRPLLSDVHSAIHLFDTGLRKKDRIISVRSHMRYQLGALAQHKVGVSPGYQSACNGSVSVSGCIRYKVSNPTLANLDQLGLVNPLYVAWQLVPLSFVVDWFIPIGDYIQSFVPPQGVDFVEGYIYTKGEGSMTHSTDLVGWSTKSSSKEVYKRRTTLSSFPRYHVVVPDLSLSVQQVVSGLSLLAQRVL